VPVEARRVELLSPGPAGRRCSALAGGGQYTNLRFDTQGNDESLSQN